MNTPLKFCVLGLLLLMASCTTGQNNGGQTAQEKAEEQSLIDANREFLKKERAQIERFIKANGFVMKQTGSGLYYMFLTEPTDTNQQVKDGDRVQYDFKISLLDGTYVNGSAESGQRTLTLGKQQAEIGLHEVFLLSFTDCPMLIILPSHLAHGISQNEDDVPPRATLIYEINPRKILN
jgi:FKBP-type peptidyl-prolyl cis-trans isomerase